MRALSLNCRGLGNQATVNELHGLVKSEGPKIVFLMETRLPVRKLEVLRLKLGMRGCFGVGRRRFGGGLALLWTEDVDVHVQSYSSSHIDAQVLQEDGAGWRITGFYGNPETALRYRSWALLRRLQVVSDRPWMLLGDFNEIVALDEKFGREDRCLRQMAGFRDVLTDCSLLDLGFIGAEFTWSNRREDGELVRVRLDRAVATPEWKLLFPNVTVHHLIFANSDHLGLLVDMVPGSSQVKQKKRRLFRFDHTWVREDGCEECIAAAWRSPQVGTPMFRLVQKIKNCRVQLLQWSQGQIRATPKLIERTKNQLRRLEEQQPADYDAGVVNRVRRELCGLMEKEETFWRQRSRVAWLQGGDLNTRFFHECASQRKRTNTLHGLMDINDTWQTAPETMEGIAYGYFAQLFRSSKPSAIDDVTQLVENIVTPEMNSLLMQPFTADEVRQALFQMHPSKAPGPDGMTALFFQKYWHIVGRDVSDAVLDFLTHGRMLGCVNFTNIVLIPKVKSYQYVSI
jgi:hypothetical protein